MKVAVVLFNLGGPESLDQVRPFLNNLFSDPAILSLPSFIRKPLAAYIAAKREKEAKHIYKAIGGGSPLRANTDAQAMALQEKLNAGGTHQFKTFVCMRYWHPMSDITARKVKDFAPDTILFLPLYPQFSATTTGSSFADFESALEEAGVSGNTHYVCCYPVSKGFISAQAALIKPVYQAMLAELQAQGSSKKPRLLFSAHGLPQKNIKAGDPYQHHCELTARALVNELAIPDLDYLNTYQSRVGPLKWIEPYTDAEITRAGIEGVPVIVVPIAFVSEHSETLYEIEQQYRQQALADGVPLFARVPTVSTHPSFIDGLASLVHDALNPTAAALQPDGGSRICPSTFTKCLCLNGPL
jgi:ferrochelatase